MFYRALIFSFAVATAAAIPVADAGGIFVGDNGTRALARAGAFAVRADDPSAIAHNPAGLAKLERPAILLGLNFVNQDNGFTRDGAYGDQIVLFGTQPEYVGDPFPTVTNDVPTQPIPMIVGALPLGNLTLAAGLFAPHAAAGRSYPETITRADGLEVPAPQRYDTIFQKGVAALPSIAAAYQIGGKLRIGARASWAFASFSSRKYVQAVPNDGEQPNLDAIATVEATDPAIFAWGVGAQLELASWFEIGAAYSSPIAVHAVGTASTQLPDLLANPLPGIEIEIVPVDDADARCAPGGQPGAIKACLDVTFPPVAAFGGRLILRDGDDREIGDLEVNLRWEGHSSMDEIRAVIDGEDSILGGEVADTVVKNGFRDSWSVRAGASRLFDTKAGGIEASAGFGYDGAAKAIEMTSVSNDGAARLTLAGGLALTRGRYRFELAGLVAASQTIALENVPVPENIGPADRPQPDVGAPLAGEDVPYHPYNAGFYYNRYWVLSTGMVATF
jgi:long-subunit fatty acid transport protein